MASYDPKKWATQSNGGFLEVADLDSHKKPRMVDSDPSYGEYIIGSVHDRFTVKIGSSQSETDKKGKCESVRLSAACLSNEATIRSVVVAVA